MPATLCLLCSLCTYETCCCVYLVYIILSGIKITHLNIHLRCGVTATVPHHMCLACWAVEANKTKRLWTAAQNRGEKHWQSTIYPRCEPSAAHGSSSSSLTTGNKDIVCENIQGNAVRVSCPETGAHSCEPYHSVSHTSLFLSLLLPLSSSLSPPFSLSLFLLYCKSQPLAWLGIKNNVSILSKPTVSVDPQIYSG